MLRSLSIKLSDRALWVRRLSQIAWVATLLFCAPLNLAVSATDPSPGVVRATLENGLRVVIVPDALAPVVTTVIRLRCPAWSTSATVRLSIL